MQYEDSALIKDIVQWDVGTWRHAIKFWEETLNKTFDDLSAVQMLDIGARDGGTSLFFAKLGMKCVCSDLNGPTENAHALHKQYGVTDKITYASVDCTNIPYGDNTFDVVSFKSVMGGVGYHQNKAAVEKAVSEIYRVLKPGGILLFAENLQASPVHRFFRRYFVKWGKRWFYIPLPYLCQLLTIFKTYELSTYGFFSCFKKDWPLFVRLDEILCKKKVSGNCYMGFGYAVK